MKRNWRNVSESSESLSPLLSGSGAARAEVKIISLIYDNVDGPHAV
jgi:hypothetical protein